VGSGRDRARGAKEVGGEREKRRKATKGDGGDGRSEGGREGEWRRKEGQLELEKRISRRS